MGYTRRRKSLPSWQSVSDEIESLVLEFYFILLIVWFLKYNLDEEFVITIVLEFLKMN